jgi:hypothetical protein
MVRRSILQQSPEVTAGWQRAQRWDKQSLHEGSAKRRRQSLPVSPPFAPFAPFVPALRAAPSATSATAAAAASAERPDLLPRSAGALAPSAAAKAGARVDANAAMTRSR